MEVVVHLNYGAALYLALGVRFDFLRLFERRHLRTIVGLRLLLGWTSCFILFVVLKVFDTYLSFQSAYIRHF